jgi:hypothetical protein
MKNLLPSVAVAAVVGALVAIAAVMSGFVAGSVGKKRVYATINISQVGGSCVIQTAPATVEMYKRETIEWTVVNSCADTVDADVEVQFDPSNDPLDGTCVRKGKKKITCTVKPAADYKGYKYKVLATGAITEDPELEIVQ